MASSSVRTTRPGLLNVLGRYALAIAAAVFASALQISLTPFLDQHYPYQTSFAAVAFAAWCCGFGPAIITMLMFGLLILCPIVVGFITNLIYSHFFERGAMASGPPGSPAVAFILAALSCLAWRRNHGKSAKTPKSA